MFAKKLNGQMLTELKNVKLIGKNSKKVPLNGKVWRKKFGGHLLIRMLLTLQSLPDVAQRHHAAQDDCPSFAFWRRLQSCNPKIFKLQMRLFETCDEVTSSFDACICRCRHPSFRPVLNHGAATSQQDWKRRKKLCLCIFPIS